MKKKSNSQKKKKNSITIINNYNLFIKNKFKNKILYKKMKNFN